jgi:hypothetical protein
MKQNTTLALTILETETRSVQIQKYSNESLISDCKMLRQWLNDEGIILNKSKKKLGNIDIGTVWRCRIGLSGWQHGWTFTEAVNAAIEASKRV